LSYTPIRILLGDDRLTPLPQPTPTLPELASAELLKLAWIPRHPLDRLLRYEDVLQLREVLVVNMTRLIDDGGSLQNRLNDDLRQKVIALLTGRLVHPRLEFPFEHEGVGPLRL
jgi:hypothetical protein